METLAEQLALLRDTIRLLRGRARAKAWYRANRDWVKTQRAAPGRRPPFSGRPSTNAAVFDGDTVWILLTRGMWAAVSASDWPMIRRVRWSVQPSSAALYVGRRVGGQVVLLHRALLSPNSDMEVDHKNCDTLDNRRENLRIATGSQNGGNRRKVRWVNGLAPSSQYKGVCYVPQLCVSKPWMAYIGAGRNRKYLGYYADEESAAAAYNQATEEVFGEFARTNVLD